MPGYPYRKKAISLVAISTPGDLKTYPTGVYCVPAGIDQQVFASDSTTPTGFNWQYVPKWNETDRSLTEIKTLQFVSGTLLDPVLTGAIEYDGVDLFYTNDSNQRQNITARPYLNAYDDGNHNIASTTTAYPITCSTTIANHDIYISNNSRIYVEHSFTYSITYSMQFINTDNNIVHDAYVWLAVTGTNVDHTNSYISIPGAHSGVDGAAVLTVNYFQYLTSGSYFELYFAANSTNVGIRSIPSAGSPTRPDSPGVILTVFRVND